MQRGIQCIKWRDSNKTVVSLKDIKDYYPVQLEEYSVEDNISMEPKFAWCVPHTSKKRNRIIAKLKYKSWMKTHKFGIQVPKTMKQAIEFDLKNDNTF